MRRIRWFERDDPATPLEWPAVALILAALFFHIEFWTAPAERFWIYWPLPVYTPVLAAIVAAVSLVFAIAPAVAVFAARKPLFETLQGSLGTAPVYAVRAAAAAFLLFWIGGLASLPVRLWGHYGSGPPWRSIAIAAAVTLFAFATGGQAVNTVARLGGFTVKLGVALMLAALLRVRDALPAIPAGFQPDGYSISRGLWDAVTDLVAYIAPLGLLAADFVWRLRGSKDVHRATWIGFGVAMFVSICLAGIVNLATAKSRLYVPSLNPTVAMALFSGVASSAARSRWAVAAVTLFGAARFGVKALSNSVPLRGRVPQALGIPLAIAAIVCIAVFPYHPVLYQAPQFFARALAVAGAILTADHWFRRSAAPPRRIDPVGCAAFLVGFALPWYTPHGAVELSPNPWWYPWILPSYVVAFAACVCGRAVERARGRRKGTAC